MSNYSDKSRTLILLFHAYGRNNNSMNAVANACYGHISNATIECMSIPSSVFSWSDLEDVCRKLLCEIDGLYAMAGPDGYDRLVLVGHSLGAAIARKVWALAHGAQPDASIDPEAVRPWAGKIDRIVLLAALGRGWRISSAQPVHKRLIWTIGVSWGNFCRYILSKEPLIFGVRRGAPFLTTTRLQCLQVERNLKDSGSPPVTVQLLGSQDDIVAPADNIDLAVGREFYYIEVLDSSHSSIVSLRSDSEREAFRTALKGDKEELNDASLSINHICELVRGPDVDLSAIAPSIVKERVDLVAFVIHGIRDPAFWTKRLARQIERMGERHNLRCWSTTPTYGYFAMLPFVLPWTRRDKVEWLLDQYVSAKALYPEAKFAYVGHSNGTYLVGEALKKCDPVEFERVVLAGSVLPSNFDWSEYIKTKRIGGVLNYVATADWVVAAFPFGMNKLWSRDLGGAGHIGFDNHESVVNVRYAKGRHSAALDQRYWEEIARFLVLDQRPSDNRGNDQSSCVKRIGNLSGFILPILIAVACGIALWILLGLSLPTWGVVLTFTAYIFILRLVITKA